MKYSDRIAGWMSELGYSTCFFVSGGHCMHLVESFSRKLRCIATVHEVTAGIAAEYFNVVAEGKERAFALVTSGPGLTNIVTAAAGAWQESRELLIIGGQAKVEDLSDGSLRQLGFQELPGAALMKPITVRSTSLSEPVDRDEFVRLTQLPPGSRPGTVFLEIPVDIQGSPFESRVTGPIVQPAFPQIPTEEMHKLKIASQMLRQASRPILLIGSGIGRKLALALAREGAFDRIPVMTTRNAADRVDSNLPTWFGRPSMVGMRHSNLLLQQADLVLAIGTRLSFSFTGYARDQFVPSGKVVQIDIDPAETAKRLPEIALRIHTDAGAALQFLVRQPLGDYSDWIAYCERLRNMLPLEDPANVTGPGFVSPFEFYREMSNLCTPDDLLTPSSSGLGFNLFYQCFRQKAGQIAITDKALAAMGYGLGGAIGMAIAGKGRRTILFEGDGGFAQNIQDLGTVAIRRLNLKIFVFDNGGYATMRMTRKNYFEGGAVGCDADVDVGLPRWDRVFHAWDIPCMRLSPDFARDETFLTAFRSEGPMAFVVPVDKAQTYFPRGFSKALPDGRMVSAPLHEMNPPLEENLRLQVTKYLPLNNSD
jgi:acetolactate synthase-1/2/3 large subunit